MNATFNSNNAIENLVAAQFPLGATPREIHVFRESLRALVRLAKMEQKSAEPSYAHLLGGGYMCMENAEVSLAA
jgi:hypothetical protein